MNKPQRICQSCGRPFYGSGDAHYCEECAAKIKSDVLRDRICMDCGTSFIGGPRARRCPKCRDLAKRNKKKKPTSRPLGSTDTCKRCGAGYTVMSGRQMYCPNCQKEALLEWQRNHKTGYNQKKEVREKKQMIRKQQEMICPYCLMKFRSETSSPYCSDYCRKEQAKYYQCEADIRRGYNRDLGKYEKLRDEYRKKVSVDK